MKQFSIRCRALLVLVCLGTAVQLTGCRTFGYELQSPIVKVKDTRVGPGKLTPDAIQSEVMSFSDTFSGTITQGWNEAGNLRADPDAPEDASYRARRSAHERKLADVTAAVSIAAGANPVVAVADMITLVTLERMQLEEPRTAEIFGAEAAAKLVATYREQEEAIWRIGKKTFTEKQAAELRELIETWRKEHPDQRYVSQIRLEDFAPSRSQEIPASSAEHGSLLSMVWLDPLAGLDPAKREVRESRLLATRAFFQLTRMPQILKWQAESFYEGFLHTPEVEKRLESVDKFADAASSIGKTAEALREDLSGQREAAIDQFFVGVTEQRKALLADLSDGREKLEGTLSEFRETVVETDKLAGSLATAAQAIESAAKQVMPKPGEVDENPGRDRLAEYRASVESTSAAAERLTVLAGKLELLFKPTPEDAGHGMFQDAVLQTRESAEQVIDRAFLRLLILILFAPLVIAVAVLATRIITQRIRHHDDVGHAQRARV